MLSSLDLDITGSGCEKWCVASLDIKGAVIDQISWFWMMSITPRGIP